jgi:lysophospholipase L1-like esterase
VWIVEGGINDIYWWGASNSTLTANYLASLTAIANYAKSCGVKLFIQELTPAIPSYIDSFNPTTAPHEPKIKQLNSLLADFGQSRQIPVIRVYDRFLPHWTATPSGWCIYQNASTVHPNATGNQALGLAWAEAVTGYALGQPQSPVRVAVFGDSIPAAVNFTEAAKPRTWFLYYANNVVPVQLSSFQID